MIETCYEDKTQTAIFWILVKTFMDTICIDYNMNNRL